MMIKAMEVSGIEGNFRFTCENVMRVLRSNKDSVMAMLEAFVHDPLINWRLLNTTDAADPAFASEAAGEKPVDRTSSTGETGGGMERRVADPGNLPSPPRREVREREALNAYGNLGAATEVLNERAVAVMKRMSDKLTGRDFNLEGMPASADSDSVQSQVQRLVEQATSHENLCQSYIGWCPFW
jgi:FKBP12-rapamycin complex-associated protein